MRPAGPGGGTRRRWAKLDTRVIDGFDAALGARGMRIATGTGAVLKALARERAWGGALAAARRAARARGDARILVAGNVARKRIRLPWLWRGPLVRAYGTIKAVQAGLLAARLEDAFARGPDLGALVYNGSNYPESVLAEVAGRLGRPRLFVEAGFFPGTLQIDREGLNGANSVPREPGFYLRAEEDFAAPGLPTVVGARAAKTGAEPVALAPGYLFVPFQVPSDMQVTLHSPWIRDMAQFLAEVRAAADRHPGERFVIKEHPSFKRSVRGLAPPHPRVIFANGNVTRDLVDGARAVVTLNSTVGLEALALDRPVIALGRACYAIEGLVLSARDRGELDAALAQSRGWRPDARLRAQVLGFLWNRYLVRGRYDDPPERLADRLDLIWRKGPAGGNAPLD